MLPQKFRLVAVNNTGGTIDNINVKYTPWYFDSSNNGQLSYGSEVDAIAATGTVDTGVEKQTEVTGNTNFGIKGSLEVIDETTPGSGNVELYIEWPDGAGTYPSDKTGAVPGTDMLLLAVCPVVAGGRMTNFTYE